MLASGDWRAWVIPHLNGLPYMEKPPLLYWLTALSFALFGESEWSARLVPALSSLACVSMLMRFGRITGHAGAGRLAGLIFVSGVGVMAMSRLLMFDMLLTACLTGALLQAWLFLQRGRLASMRWSYVCLALAVLTKGLVALVLFGLVMLGTLLLAASARAFWRNALAMLQPSGLLLFVAIAVPWHVAAALVEPVFGWFYFYNEHVLRFLGQREPHDYYGGPWWYYLPRMLLYLFPWCFLALWRLAPLRGGDDPGLRRFLFLAWLLPLLFFSMSTAKANYYLVAVMPFAAFHLALVVVQRQWHGSWLRMLPAMALLLLCLVLAAVAASRPIPRQVDILGMPEQQFLSHLFGYAAVIALLLLIAAWRRPALAVLPMLAMSFWFAGGLGLALSAMEPWASTRQLARTLLQQPEQRPVLLFRDFEKKSSLAFYLKQPLGVVDSISADLHWGNRLRPNDRLISREQLLELASQRKLLLAVTDEHLKDFQTWNEGRRFTALLRNGNVTVFAN